MTGKELAEALLALPEEQQALQVFSTADWDLVGGVELMADYTVDGKPVLELQGWQGDLN